MNQADAIIRSWPASRAVLSAPEDEQSAGEIGGRDVVGEDLEHGDLALDHQQLSPPPSPVAVAVAVAAPPARSLHAATA